MRHEWLPLRQRAQERLAEGSPTLHPAPEQQAGIHPAEAEAIGQRVFHRPAPGFAANQVEALGVGVGRFQVECGGGELVAQCQDREDRLDAAGGRQEVAGGGFGRADGEPAAGAEHGLDGGQFALVAYLGGGGVGIQVLHRGRFHAGLAQRLLHGPAGTAAIFRPGGHVVGVGAGAVAHQLGDGPGAARQGVLQFLDDQ